MTEIAAPTRARSPIVLVMRNRNLRRIQLAFAGSSVGDWAYATGIAVWAYEGGGATVVGVWMAVRFAIMALTSPIAAIWADRRPRREVMILADLVRAVLVSLAAVCIVIDASVLTVLTLGTVTSLLGQPFRIAQRSILPQLTDEPEELAAANGVSSTIDSLAMFAGPAIAGFLLAVASVPVVFLLDVATFIWSMALVSRIRVTNRPDAGRLLESDEDQEGHVAAALAGFRLIWGNEGLRAIVLGVTAQTVVAGASSVFVLVMAAETLQQPKTGYAMLESSFGIGALVGGLVAIGRARRGRSGTDFIAGCLLWSLPLLIFALVPTPVTAFVSIALLGFGNPLVDVNMDTMIQRLSPDDALGRVFGAGESLMIGGMCVGSLAAPLLLRIVGLEWTVAVIALLVAAAVVSYVRPLQRLDRSAPSPTNLRTWTAVDLFAPMPPLAVEVLARGARTTRVPAGEVVVAEGEESDRFYVIVSGEVEATQAGRFLRTEGAGEYFGEIGLLRDVPRTATVTARTDTTLESIDRKDFLSAVLGQRRSRLLAEDVATRRLAT